MGYWYETCFMSNTPILTDEKIAIFVLAPKYRENTIATPGFARTAEEKFTTVGFPIIAEFDEDRGFKNISHVNSYAERYFENALPLYKKNSFTDEEDSFEEYQWKGIERFVDDLMRGTLFVKCEDNHIRQMAYVMMHEELRQELLRGVASRIPYGETDTFADLMRERVESSIAKCKGDYDAWVNMPQTVKDKFKFSDFTSFSMHSRFFSLEMWDNLDTMAAYHAEDPEYEIIDEIVDHAMWRIVMNYGRKGYHCYPAGSQCEDMQFHKIIAEFTLQKYDERKRTRRVEEYLSF
jgi:hypothetical protein